MPVADTNKMPPMTVREAEPEVKEEPKKEIPIGDNLLPVTEKTEVKAVETPSDKMVIKSEKKEEPVKVPSYKGIDKNLDIAGGVFIDKSNISEGLDAKDLSPKEILDNDLLGKNWHTIELNRNVSSRYPDPPNVNTKNLKSYNQDENFNVFKPIDIDGKKFYSNYDKKNNKWYLYEEGSNKDNWTEVKVDPIKSMLSSKYLKYGQPIKESRDYSESDYNEIESAKKKLSYSKYLQYLVSNVNDLSPEEKSKVKEILGDKNNDKMYRWISYNVDDPKIADFWVNALEKLDIQSLYLDDIKKRRDDLTQQPQGTMQVKEVTEQPKVEVKAEEPKMEVKEVTKEEPKMKVKGKMKVAPEPIKIEPIKVETKGGQIQVEVPTFAIPEPKKKYKPYGEKGPDVYYSEDFDQYIIKEGDSKTIVDKGSPKYDEIDKKIGETVKGTIEGTGKCDPDESGDSCSKNTLILSDFINNNFGDDGEIGWRASSEGKLIHKLNEDKKDFDKNQVSRYVEFSAMDLEDQNEKDPEVQAINKSNYEYNQKAGQIWYANDEPPKDKRFVIYKPYGDDRTLIYDKESEVILKQIDKAPEVDLSSTNPIFDTKGNIVQKGSNRREFYKNYKKNNPDKGLNVWYGYHKDRPEYKDATRQEIWEGVRDNFIWGFLASIIIVSKNVEKRIASSSLLK